MKKFDLLCQDYGIAHQFTTPTWPQCNGMVECLIQTIKYGLIMMSLINTQCRDDQLPNVLFGYWCGITTIIHGFLRGSN
jgi:hypothetical protein